MTRGPKITPDPVVHPDGAQSEVKNGGRQGAATRPIVVVTLIVFLGLLLFLTFGPGTDVDPSENGAPSSTEASTSRAPGSNLPVTLSVCERAGDSLVAEGYVLNEGGVNVRYVQVELTWEDASGNPADGEITYAIGGEIFAPGDSITFRGATGEASAADCQASLFDYEPL